MSRLHRVGHISSPSHPRQIVRLSRPTCTIPPASNTLPFVPLADPFYFIKSFTAYHTQGSRPIPPLPSPRLPTLRFTLHLRLVPTLSNEPRTRVAATALLSGLLDEVRALGRIRRHHLNTLVLPQLQQFSITSVGETFLALHFLMQRCRVRREAVRSTAILGRPPLGYKTLLESTA